MIIDEARTLNQRSSTLPPAETICTSEWSLSPLAPLEDDDEPDVIGCTKPTSPL